MSALGKEGVFITFDELLQLKPDDVSLCIDKYSALNICGNSSAPPIKIYNLWVQKLFKVYNAEGFTTKDWEKIIEYLEEVLRKFVEDFSDSDEKNSCRELEQLWLDSQDLMKWINAIIDSLDVSVISLLMAFVLDVIIKTSGFSNKNNLKIVCNIQQLVVNLCNNYLYKIPIKNEKELRNFNKIVSSLCDVGSVMSSVDLKTSVETWRAVAKLSETFFNLDNKTLFPKNSLNPERDWSDKAILGIFKEILFIVKVFDRNPGENANLLQIIQFYLRILILIITYSEKTSTLFPATEEFIQLYTFCLHKMVSSETSKIELLVKEPLFNIFLIIYKTNTMTEAILQHLKYDMNKFESCNLVFDYLKLYIDNCKANFLKPDVEMALKLYNGLLEGPLIFIDKDKYTLFLRYFWVLTVMDTTNMMHKELCKYVMDSSWIRAYASMEILSIYYRCIFKQQKLEVDSKCFKFWFAAWNKLNEANETYKQHKKLVEVLLEVILSTIPPDMLLEYNFNMYENNEIILLKSGKHIENCLQYLNMNLSKNLKKLKGRSINGASFNELVITKSVSHMLNLLEICLLRPQLLSSFLKENLLGTLKDLLILPAADLHIFHEFINLSFGILNLKLDQQQNEELLKYLMEHQEQCCSIQSVFLVEFLLKLKPHSAKLIQTLETSDKLTSAIVNAIDCKPLQNPPSIDLNIFKNLSQPSTLQSIDHNNDHELPSKRPCLDKGNIPNIKVILSDLNNHAQKLLSFPPSTFDDNDFMLMRKVKNTIEKCLTV